MSHERGNTTTQRQWNAQEEPFDLFTQVLEYPSSDLNAFDLEYTGNMLLDSLPSRTQVNGKPLASRITVTEEVLSLEDSEPHIAHNVVDVYRYGNNDTHTSYSTALVVPSKKSHSSTFQIVIGVLFLLAGFGILAYCAYDTWYTLTNQETSSSSRSKPKPKPSNKTEKEKKNEKPSGRGRGFLEDNNEDDNNEEEEEDEDENRYPLPESSEFSRSEGELNPTPSRSPQREPKSFDPDSLAFSRSGFSNDDEEYSPKSDAGSYPIGYPSGFPSQREESIYAVAKEEEQEDDEDSECGDANVMNSFIEVTEVFTQWIHAHPDEAYNDQTEAVMYFFSACSSQYELLKTSLRMEDLSVVPAAFAQRVCYDWFLLRNAFYQTVTGVVLEEPVPRRPLSQQYQAAFRYDTSKPEHSVVVDDSEPVEPRDRFYFLNYINNSVATIKNKCPDLENKYVHELYRLYSWIEKAFLSRKDSGAILEMVEELRADVEQHIAAAIGEYNRLVSVYDESPKSLAPSYVEVLAENVYDNEFIFRQRSKSLSSTKSSPWNTLSSKTSASRSASVLSSAPHESLPPSIPPSDAKELPNFDERWCYYENVEYCVNEVIHHVQSVPARELTSRLISSVLEKYERMFDKVTKNPNGSAQRTIELCAEIFTTRDVLLQISFGIELSQALPYLPLVSIQAILTDSIVPQESMRSVLYRGVEINRHSIAQQFLALDRAICHNEYQHELIASLISLLARTFDEIEILFLYDSSPAFITATLDLLFTRLRQTLEWNQMDGKWVFTYQTFPTLTNQAREGEELDMAQ